MSVRFSVHRQDGVGGGAWPRSTLALAAILLVSVGLAASPLLSTGAVLGVALVTGTVLWPTIVVGLMLALGPVDLSFITGGSRELLEDLGGLDMSGIRLVAISVGLGIVLVTRRAIAQRLLAPSARWYVLFLLYAAASIAASPLPLEGLRLLVKLAYPLLVFLVIASPERTGAEVRRLIDWALVGAALLLLVNPAFVMSGGYSVESGEWLRVWGPGSHHNPFSFYLLTVLLLALARFRTRGEIRYLLLGLMAVIWIALTLTRITMLAGFVAMGGVALYSALMDRNRRVPLAILAFGGLAAIFLVEGILVRTFGYVPTPGEFFQLASDPLRLYQSINWQGRETLWAILWIEFMESPWLGSGLGASTAVLQSMRFTVDVAHNEYLRLAVDTGVIGCVLFFLAVLGWIRSMVRVEHRTSQSDEFTLPGLAAIAAWAVIALTDNAFDYYGPFTQYIGLLVAGAVVTGRQRSAPEVEPAEADRQGPGEALAGRIEPPLVR